MILKEVRNNKIESYFIISLFIIFVMLVVYFICIYLELGSLSIIISLAFALFSALASYYSCDTLVLNINGARPATEEQDKLLSSILDNLCIASGLPRPKLYVINDPSPNAFATGRNPQNAFICVTTGLLEKMNKYELEGVIAHELSHIKNYDILLSTIVSVFVGFVVIISDFIFRFGFMRNSDRDSKSNPIIMLIGLLFLLLSPLFATLMQLALSRKREYLADSSAIEITRNPEGLISALKKLSDAPTNLKTANKATAHMYIVNPLKNKKEKTNLFSTHPPINERIKRLEHIN